MCMQLQYTVRAEFETSFKRWIIELIRRAQASYLHGHFCESLSCGNTNLSRNSQQFSKNKHHLQD